MDELTKQLLEMNRLCNENADIYHKIAVQYDISDTEHWILYMLCAQETPMSQTELSESWHLPKQTINFSVAAMAKRGWLTLETIPGTRNRKSVVLTEAGRAFCAEAIGATQEIERSAFSRFTEQERSLFLSLYRRNNQYMREEMTK